MICIHKSATPVHKLAESGQPIISPLDRIAYGSGEYILPPDRDSSRPARFDSITIETRDRLLMSTIRATPRPPSDSEPATLPLHAIHQVPDHLGRFGVFGGRFVPETLMDALNQLAEEYERAKVDPEFQARLNDYLKHYVGRPSPLYLAERLTAFAGGAEIYLKREDLNHTGAHKINNAIGQVMLAQRMGKKRVIAETGAGQHGVATATACALFGLECTVYMGEEDIRRQKLNVFNMRTMGAKVVPVTTGSRTLRDATNEAMRDWMGSSKETHYTIGSVVGPHPFPMIVRDFQSVIGRETRAAVPGAARPPARHRRSPAWAAARTRRGCFIRSSRTPRSSWSAPRPAAGASRPASMPPA